MGKSATEKKEHRKIMLQNTFMTESDVSLSFSRDGQLFTHPFEKNKSDDKNTHVIKK